MPSKSCRNTECEEPNPEFNPGRNLCKKCHSKQCSELRRKRKNKHTPVEQNPDKIYVSLDEINQLRNMVTSLSKQLEHLTMAH